MTEDKRKENQTTEEIKPEGELGKIREVQLVTKSGTIMTHLMTYTGPNGSEYRLHDAEYKGKHYFDFRKYDQRTRGGIPTRGGIRLNPRLLEFLEDSMMRWRRFYKQTTIKEVKHEI